MTSRLDKLKARDNLRDNTEVKALDKEATRVIDLIKKNTAKLGELAWMLAPKPAADATVRSQKLDTLLNQTAIAKAAMFGSSNANNANGNSSGNANLTVQIMTVSLSPFKFSYLFFFTLFD